MSIFKKKGKDGEEEDVRFYWLAKNGNNLSLDKKLPSIKKDEEIPQEYIEKISEKRFKYFVDKGMIGEAPSVDMLKIVSENAKEGLKEALTTIKIQNTELTQTKEKLAQAQTENGELIKANQRLSLANKKLTKENGQFSKEFLKQSNKLKKLEKKEG